MSTSLDASRKHFLKALELFSEMLDLCTELVNEYLDVILNLIQNLLSSAENEDLLKLGANFMASICDTGDFGYIDFQQHHYELMI